MSKKDLNDKNAILMTNSIVRIGFSMSKYDIPPQFDCQNRTLNVKLRYLASVRMSNTSMNVELQYLASVRVSKWDFEC